MTNGKCSRFRATSLLCTELSTRTEAMSIRRGNYRFGLCHCWEKMQQKTRTGSTADLLTFFDIPFPKIQQQKKTGKQRLRITNFILFIISRLVILENLIRPPIHLPATKALHNFIGMKMKRLKV